MPTTTALGGTLFFKIDGVQYALAGSFSYDLGGIERASRVGPDGVHGFIQKFRSPSIDCELQDSGALSISTIQAITGSALTAELANGKTVILQGAYQMGDIVNDVVDTKIKTKFGGISAQEF